ncbi:MAG: endonuclease/exonuclease/phosphatase family protein [Jatrophihabitantaceae bacterium]
MPTLRLLTYNVRSMRDDRAALGRVISSAEADVVCIQEAPRFLRWRSLCAELARRSGLVVVSGGRTAAAQLILSNLRVDVISTQDVKFSKDPGLHQRGTAIAVLRLAGSTFGVAGTHLDVVEPPRLQHIRELDAAIARYIPAGLPTVVAGDMNDKPGSKTWDALVASRTDVMVTDGGRHAFTSTAAEPHQRIDGIFLGPGLVVRSVRVIDTPDTKIASDHLPILAELELS